MSNKKATKRALLTSILAICLCLVMLIGSTFAWFTDTASTSVNKIESGTLDVQLLMPVDWDEDGNVTKWDTAEGKTLDFVKAKGAENEQVLWEPNCTYELPALKIVNNGNLALKYKIQITGAKDANADNNKDDLILLNVIDWTYEVDDTAYTLESEKSLAAKSESEDSYDILTIKGHMQETAGNDYQGLSINGIAITVLATQDTVENDSYNNQYDKSADYPEVQAVTTLDDLKTALDSEEVNGKTIKFYDSVDVEDLQIKDKDIALDLNGKNIDTERLQINNSTVVITDSSENEAGQLQTNDSYGVINAVNSDVTIESGNFTSTYNKEGSSGYASVIQVRNSTLTINGGHFENTETVGSYNYLIKAPSYSKTEKTTITINGGEFVSHKDYGYVVTGDSDANVDVIINGGTFTTEGRNSYLTNVKGSVIVNNCTFIATGNNTVFNIPANSTVTVKGGTFSVNENSYTDPSLAGLIFHRKTNGWTSVSGTLLVDPTNMVKVNQLTYSGFIAEGATQSSNKDTEGFYTISK